jgi:hypothetical protein
LDPQQLYRLIDAIARSDPKVIGVDIDTSDPSFRDLKPDPRWPPVVWARNIILYYPSRPVANRSQRTFWAAKTRAST